MLAARELGMCQRALGRVLVADRRTHDRLRVVVAPPAPHEIASRATEAILRQKRLPPERIKLVQRAVDRLA